LTQLLFAKPAKSKLSHRSSKRKAGRLMFFTRLD
jgi:hypothetical protein